MKTYEVFYSDGNRCLFETENIVMLMKALIEEEEEYSKNIIKIEEREVK